ncbi:hypothetical protein EJ04DRAFT_569494 [Polyplosphaeria fusca]|uniref:Uncharacterized protein n=1 Tax=Polyplosphaeria fusca TaxID=682080 RepID=A0A9P4QJJ2_9PLEO|nr:hypothetical protein EJ04DRAFT_569494 [Polyplosphaeria fusca]
MSDSIYDIRPSRAHHMSTADTHTSPTWPAHPQPSPTPQTSRSSSPTKALKAAPTFLSRHLNRARTLPMQHPDPHNMDLHHSVCLNMNDADSADSASCWILPDFDDWAADMERSQPLVPPNHNPSSSPPATATADAAMWAPLLRRAANSNRERLRSRLEGDGWDFVGGRYRGEVEDAEAESVGEESIDEEFDVVVLGTCEGKMDLGA